MNTITGIGSALFDMLLYCNTFPPEDKKMEADKTVLQGGGPCSTALVAASKLGIQTGYIGLVGDDFFGDFIRNDFQKYNVDVTGLHTVKNCRSFHSMVLCSKEKGSRTCVWNKGNLPEPNAADFNLTDLLKGTKIVHLDGYYTKFAVEAAKIVHKAGGLVSLDAGTIRPGIEDVMKQTDILIASADFAKTVGGCSTVTDAVIALNRKYHPAHLAVTCGADGGLFLQKGKPVQYPAYKSEVVDSNGAGDVFHGAFLVGLLKGWDDEKCCWFGSAVSAMKCKVYGARAGVPSFADAVAFYERKELEA